MEKEKVEELLFSSSTASSLQPVWEALDDLLAAQGLERYAKTVSVSYTKDDVVVAAIHPVPHRGELQVALALPTDIESARLQDMSALRWRTMPRGIVVRAIGDVDDEVGRLIASVMSAPEVTGVTNDHYVSERDKRIRQRIRQRWDGTEN